jgi:hypothetical protein
MRLGWRKLLPASIGNIIVTALLILAAQSAGPQLARGLDIAADFTKLVLALGGLAVAVILVLFLLKPANKKRFLASSSAQFAAQLGGTRSARMEA